MNTEYLKQFALLAKEGRFQTAADKLFISQSTLSKHIASLEQELGPPCSGVPPGKSGSPNSEGRSCRTQRRSSVSCTPAIRN